MSPQILSCFKILRTRLLALPCRKMFFLPLQQDIYSKSRHASPQNSSQIYAYEGRLLLSFVIMMMMLMMMWALPDISCGDETHRRRPRGGLPASRLQHLPVSHLQMLSRSGCSGATWFDLQAGPQQLQNSPAQCHE